MGSRLTVNVRTAARLLGISHQTCYDAIRRGQIPAIRAGARRVVIPRHALEQILGVKITDEMLDELRDK